MLDGRRVRQIIMAVFFGTLYLAYTFGTPYYIAYSARPITRRACSDQIQEDRRKASPLFRTQWENRFISKLRSEGIFVENDQYLFSLYSTGQGRFEKWTCEGQLKFALDNPWVPDFGLFEAPTFRTVHSVDVQVEYKR